MLLVTLILWHLGQVKGGKERGSWVDPLGRVGPYPYPFFAQTLFCSRTLPSAGRATHLGPSPFAKSALILLDRWQSVAISGLEKLQRLGFRAWEVQRTRMAKRKCQWIGFAESARGTCRRSVREGSPETLTITITSCAFTGSGSNAKKGIQRIPTACVLGLTPLSSSGSARPRRSHLGCMGCLAQR